VARLRGEPRSLADSHQQALVFRPRNKLTHRGGGGVSGSGLACRLTLSPWPLGLRSGRTRSGLGTSRGEVGKRRVETRVANCWPLKCLCHERAVLRRNPG
jgi:hypothetical protein